MKFKNTSNRFFYIAISIIVFLILVVGVLLVLNILDENQSKNVTPQPSYDSSLMYIDGSPYKLKSNMETILFIGTDKFEDEDISDNSFRNDQQNDFNLLIVIDNNSQKYTPILINRDTMTDIQTYSVSGQKLGAEYKQLALAHTYGTGSSDSCINVSEAISNLMYNVNIDHYASVTLDAISVLNDAVGGVTLTVLDDMSEIDEEMYEGVELTLDGEQAEIYIRSRYGLDDSTNENRMERQKQYMTEWVKQAKQGVNSDSSFSSNVIIKISDYLTTDMSVSYMSKISEKLSEYSQNEILELSGTTSVVNNHTQFKADDTELKNIVKNIFYESA